MDSTELLDHSSQEFKNALTCLYESKRNTDLEIVCGNEVFKVHSFLLWPRSKFFEVACHGPFNEAKTKRIELPDDKPDLVYRMIRYFYMLDYQDFVDPKEKHDIRTVVNAEMYALADKYGIKGLKKHVVRKMKLALSWAESFASKSAVASNLAVLIPIVYNTTPDKDRGLRDCIVPFAFTFWRELSTLKSFKDILLATPVFVIDMVGKVDMAREAWNPMYNGPHSTPEPRPPGAIYPYWMPRSQHRGWDCYVGEAGAWSTVGQADTNSSF